MVVSPQDASLKDEYSDILTACSPRVVSDRPCGDGTALLCAGSSSTDPVGGAVELIQAGKIGVIEASYIFYDNQPVTGRCFSGIPCGRR
jgi:hypothetical protein